MNIPVSITKIIPPLYQVPSSKRQSIPSFLPREELVQQLNALPPGDPVIVRGPDGSGKGLLLNSWISSSKDGEPRPTAWLTLDEGDNDPARFLAGIVASLNEAILGLGASVLADLESPQPPNLLSHLTLLSREISAVQTPLIMVWDHYETITSYRIHRAVSHFLKILPKTMNIGISTTLDIPENLDVLLQTNRWKVITEEDLRLSRKDIQNNLKNVYGVSLTKHQAVLLTERTNGLSMAVQMAGQVLKTHSDPESFWKVLANETTPALEFIFDQIMESQMEAVREFLVCTVILKRMNGPLCDEIMRSSPSGLRTPGRGKSTLEHLSKNRIFTYFYPGEENWYRYHPLFANLLWQRLHRLYPGIINNLHQRASRWFEINNHLEEAMLHAIQTGDEERASAIIEMNALKLIGKGQLNTVLSWLGRLSAGLILLRPWLCLAEAWGVSYEGWQEGVETLLSTVHTASTGMAPGAARRVIGHIAAIRLALTDLQTEHQQADELARTALEFLPPEDRSIRCHVANTLGMSLRERGQLSAAAEAFTEGIACTNQGTNHTASVLAFCRLADLHIIDGRFQKALALCDEAFLIAEKHKFNQGNNLLPVGLAHIYAGLVSYERDDLELAQGHIETGIPLCQAWGNFTAAALGQVTYAAIFTARGNLTAAQEAADEAISLLAQSKQTEIETDPYQFDSEQGQAAETNIPFLVIQPATVMARLIILYLEWEQLDIAAALVKEYNFSPDDEFSFSESPFYLSMIHLYLAQGNIFTARRLLRRISQVCELNNANYYLSIANVLQAQLSQQANDYQSVLSFLRRVIQMVEYDKLIRIFIDGQPALKTPLTHISEGGPGSHFARDILSALQRQSHRIVDAAKKDSQPIKMLPQPLPAYDGVNKDSFTEREFQILKLLENYMTVLDIASHLGISDRTVDTIIRNICRKLGVSVQQQAVIKARELKII